MNDYIKAIDALNEYHEQNITSDFIYDVLIANVKRCFQALDKQVRELILLSSNAEVHDAIWS